MVLPHLDATDDLRSLRFQLRSVALVRLLLAVFESTALVVLQQPVLAAEVAVAEAAVTNNTLGRLSTLLGTASDLLGSHLDSRLDLRCERENEEA